MRQIFMLLFSLSCPFQTLPGCYFYADTIMLAYVFIAKYNIMCTDTQRIPILLLFNKNKKRGRCV